MSLTSDPSPITGHGLRAKRDSLARSERGVWGVRRSTPQLKKRQ
jgi:hypothetical protein